MFLARMISQAKWRQLEWMNEGDISADALTCDLRTLENNLSFWRCNEASIKDIEDVALAIASGRDKIEKIDLVLINDSHLKNDCKTKESKGRTPVENLVDLHVDVFELNYYRLGVIARCIASAIADDQCYRVTKKRIETLLITAIIEEERLLIGNLNDKLRPHVQRLLNW